MGAAVHEETVRSVRAMGAAGEGEETEWVLCLPAGFLRPAHGDADAPADDADAIWPDHAVGRSSYGGFTRRKAPARATAEDEEGDDEKDNEPGAAGASGSEGDDYGALKRRAEALALVDRINLKKMGFISGFSPRRGPQDWKGNAKRRNVRSSLD